MGMNDTMTTAGLWTPIPATATMNPTGAARLYPGAVEATPMTTVLMSLIAPFLSSWRGPVSPLAAGAGIDVASIHFPSWRSLTATTLGGGRGAQYRHLRLLTITDRPTGPVWVRPHGLRGAQMSVAARRLRIDAPTDAATTSAMPTSARPLSCWPRTRNPVSAAMAGSRLISTPNREAAMRRSASISKENV